MTNERLKKTKPRQVFSIRLSPEEQERAERVAEHFELSIGAVLRSLLLEKSRELGITPPAPASRTRMRRKA